LELFTDLGLAVPFDDGISQDADSDWSCHDGFALLCFDERRERNLGLWQLAYNCPRKKKHRWTNRTRKARGAGLSEKLPRVSQALDVNLGKLPICGSIC
jgi:hypothetical protein